MSRVRVGERFVSDHWRQRGLTVEVLRVGRPGVFGRRDVEVRVVELGACRNRQIGDQEVMSYYMLDPLECRRAKRYWNRVPPSGS